MAKLLYIEDDSSQRENAAQSLREQGFDVLTAASGSDGIDVLRKQGVDVVICDLNMPRMNGLQVLKHVKQEFPDLPVIIMTARGTVKNAVEAIQQGAVDFALKPFEVHKMAITAKKAIESAHLRNELQKTESNLRMILETVPDIVYSLNPEGRFLSLSPAVRGLLGYEPAELLGRSVFDLVHSEDRQPLKQGFERTVQSMDATIKTVQFRMVAKSGEVRHFEVNRRLIIAGGKVVRQDGVARDISQRVKLQQELQDYSRELESKVDERTERLEYTNRQLTALNRASARFTQILDEAELFDELPELLTHTLDFDRAYFIQQTDNGLKLRSFCMEKDKPDVVETFLTRVNSGQMVTPPHFHDSIRNDKTIFIPNLNADPKWPRDGDKPVLTKALVIAPIRANSKPIGLIVGNMQHHERDMDLPDVERFQVFANMASLALDNIRAYQSMERKVIERTKSLRDTNRKIREKTRELEQKTYSLARANVKLLAVREELEAKNHETQNLLHAVSESEERFRQLNENIKEVFWMVDLDEHKLLYVSPSYTEIFGRSCEALYADPGDWLKAVHPDDLPELTSRMSESRRAENDQEFRIILPDHSVRWIHSRAFPVRNADGEVYRYCGVNQDITEQVVAREALQRERNFVAAVLDTAGALITVVTTAGRIIRFNRACEITTGYAFDEVKDKYFWDLFILPEETEKVRANFEQLLGGDFPSYQENCWRTKSGDRRLIAWSNSALLDGSSAPEYVIGIGIDITEARKAEKALQESLAVVERTNRDLRETQGQLVQSEKMASLGMLVAGIAHEINTPIGAVASMQDTLKRAVTKLKETLESNYSEVFAADKTIASSINVIQEANRIIDNGTERVTTIVKRLRSFARLDEAELKTADIHQGIEDTLTLIHHQIKHTITVKKIFGEIPAIACFPGRLNQVYLNLLINAKQAIKDRGEITIKTYCRGKRVFIEISDNGVGIPKEKVSRIFDPGFTTKGVGVGTGLGLSICYRIIQDHKGEIRVESREKSGTKFTIEIPSNLDEILEKT